MNRHRCKVAHRDMQVQPISGALWACQLSCDVSQSSCRIVALGPVGCESLSRLLPSTMGKRGRRTAEQLADMRADSLLKLRAKVAEEKVKECMKFEPACISAIMQCLKDTGTLARYASAHPKESNPALAD
jgi:hypothetical protein